MPYQLKDWLLTYLAAIWTSRTPTWVYAVALLPSCAIIALLAIQPWVPLFDLVGDPLAVVRECLQDAATLAQARSCNKPYFGLLSNLGILLWCVSTIVSLFAFFQVYNAREELEPAAFLLYAGILTGALLMDDLFQGHEIVYPKAFHISEAFSGMIYALFTASYILIFRDYALQADPKILCLGIIFLALSLTMDMLEKIDGLFEFNGVFHRVAEYGSKFVGIGAWAVFHIRVAWLMTSESIGIRISRSDAF